MSEKTRVAAWKLLAGGLIVVLSIVTWLQVVSLNKSFESAQKANGALASDVTELRDQVLKICKTEDIQDKEKCELNVPPPPSGEAGPQGVQGIQGIPGIPGIPGPRGPQGVQGSQGKQGAIGPRGPRGRTGAKGDKGDIGEPGSPGVDGVDGAQGPAGPPGPEGPQGPRGNDGSPGDTTIEFYTDASCRPDGEIITSVWVTPSGDSNAFTIMCSSKKFPTIGN